MTHLSGDVLENLVATVVDMLSISVAYQIGINQLGLLVGLLYAILDAYLVIWQRRRLTRLMHAIARGFSQAVDSLATAIREAS